jgi:hypothetical protein
LLGEFRPRKYLAGKQAGRIKTGAMEKISLAGDNHKKCGLSGGAVGKTGCILVIVFCEDSEGFEVFKVCQGVNGGGS